MTGTRATARLRTLGGVGGPRVGVERVDGVMRWVTCPDCGQRTFSMTTGGDELLERHRAKVCPHAPPSGPAIDLRAVVDLTGPAPGTVG